MMVMVKHDLQNKAAIHIWTNNLNMDCGVYDSLEHLCITSVTNLCTTYICFVNHIHHHHHDSQLKVLHTRYLWHNQVPQMDLNSDYKDSGMKRLQS